MHDDKLVTDSRAKQCQGFVSAIEHHGFPLSRAEAHENVKLAVDYISTGFCR